VADKKILLKPTRYCATRSPKSFEEDFFILTYSVSTLKFLSYLR